MIKLGLLAVLTLAAGCASSQEKHLGGYMPGHYLANVVLLDDAKVRQVCRNSNAWACTWIVWHEGIGEIWQVFRSTLGVDETTIHGAVHELCHAVADLQLVLLAGFGGDPCHREDGGVLPNGQPVVEPEFIR